MVRWSVEQKWCKRLQQWVSIVLYNQMVEVYKFTGFGNIILLRHCGEILILVYGYE